MSMLNHFITKLFANQTVRHPFVVHTPDEDSIAVGQGEPVFQVYIRNAKGTQAVMSFNQLRIANAYIAGDIELEGDVIKALALQAMIPDNNRWIKMWRILKPKLLGRSRCNPDFVALHYDADNIQLMMNETEYHTYTPGIYLSEDDTPEQAGKRRIEHIVDSLQLQAGQQLLDIGCGWGGITRHASRRGIQVTGITLSNKQREFTLQKLAEENLQAEVLYQDFFTFNPSVKYDGITMMGVMEELSDYEKVLSKLLQLIKPGGKIYMDFAASQLPNSTTTYISQYIWPGTFRMVYTPEFIKAVSDRPFEILWLENDRRNYYLWTKKMTARWEQNKAKIVAKSSEELWRIFYLMIAGTATTMSTPDHDTTAFRLLLELPADSI